MTETIHYITSFRFPVRRERIQFKAACNADWKRATRNKELVDCPYCKYIIEKDKTL